MFLEGSNRAVPFLIATLKNPDLDLRAEAILTLGRTGAPAIPALLTALHDPDVRVSSGAALAFWRMAKARRYALNPNNTMETVVAALRTVLNKPDERLRYRAILALRDLQPDANDLPQIPAAALRDEDKAVRARAAFETDWHGS